MTNATIRAARVLIPALLFMADTGRADGTFGVWSADPGGDLEFGITSLVGADPESAPWALEGGYNGAYWFDGSYSVGQTFTVASDRALQSVSVRVNSGRDTTGRFEIAIYAFDPDTSATTTRLASATGDAGDYRYDLQSVPVSTFNLSGAGVTLTVGQTYMLTFRGLEDSAGTFYSQAATNIYGGGSVHQSQYVPIGPDLTGEWTLKRDGRYVTGTLRVENTGTAPTESGYSIHVHRSADGVTPGKLLFTRRVPKRRQAAFKSFPLRFRAPAAGWVIAEIDQDEQIAETNEENNVVVLHRPEVE